MMKIRRSLILLRAGAIMARWKVNLIVLWIGQFLVMSGMTMIIQPIMADYLTDLAVR
jgi:DHA1 family multidrug resistance protein-like MFS transporter